MFRLEHCCCGCKLRTGTIVFLCIKASFAIYQLFTVLQDMKKNDLSHVEPARFRYVLYNFTSTFAMIVACCTGIRVITKSRAKFLVPFICCQFMLLLLYSAFFLWFWLTDSLYITELLEEVSKFMLDEHTKYAVDVFLEHKPYIYAGIVCVFLGLNVYFTLVVYNYCVKLREEASFGYNPRTTVTYSQTTQDEAVGFIRS